MENEFLATIRTSGSIQTMPFVSYSKRAAQNQKKNESPENTIAQIMTLFLPFLKESMNDNTCNQLQHKLEIVLREYKKRILLP